MEKLRISVILPCYNVEKYIRRGLDSIIAQSLQEWEAILVDDGATDSTGKICDEYSQKDHRFRVVHTTNQGVSCARNTGMAFVHGELLYFMDPDDWIEPNCFERCYEAYKRYDCDIVNFGFWWVYEKNTFTDSNFSFRIFRGTEIYDNYTKPIIGFSQEALNQFYKGAFIWDYKKTGFIWIYMFKTDFLKRHGLLFPVGLKMSEDEIFIVEATYRATTIVRIPDVFYHYIQRADGALNTKKDSNYYYDYKFRQLTERKRLRNSINEFDLHESYLGTHVFSCLRLALSTSDEWKNYKLFHRYVTHPDIQESIKEISLKSAPLKFSIPVRLLKTHCHLLLFAGCWLTHQLRITFSET